MIDNMELLRMIMENNPGQPATFILEQYAVYKAGLMEINGRFVAGAPMAELVEAAAQAEQQETMQAPKAEKESLTRGYTKRSLKVKPADAIHDDKIICCICGKECQTLTERHLASHNGLTREGYLKLCGYAPTQSLMSNNHLQRMRNNVIKAQKVRKAKAGDAPVVKKSAKKDA